MDLNRWAKIEEIFQAALDRPMNLRDEFIDEQCAGDEALRGEVQKLVARSERDENFLESPAWTDSLLFQSQIKKEIASSLEEDLASDERNRSYLGRMVGAYRLVSEIGRGGMGVVYLGERADGEFRQRVAVKLIKRGMDTDFIVRRFRHERQILAALNHQNIARLFDGGTTFDDLPYFAMEYIEGEPLFKFCRDNNLDIRKRLAIFREICQAVAYAHSKQIIHRDIKPGNILVAAGGTPKLLDFGIAKILDEDLIHESIVPTATAMRLMTPEYASPEQVRGDEITPASDQYSLGVLLYELLTGNRPYQFPSRAPHEIARVICEEIPSGPSSGEFGQITGDANLLNFGKDFCEKLDRIVLKALRKNPVERYASVTELSADIERFLNNEAIRAESFDEKSVEKSVEKTTAPDFGSPSVSNQKSIAVLPFKTRHISSDDATTGSNYLNIGLADALITRLSHVKQFVVRPTSSVLRYAEDTNSFAAGRQLNVAYVLDGNILKTETRIRVTIQLLNVAENSVIWAERFDEDLTDVLTLEDQISEKVGKSLIPHLSTGDREKLAKRGTDDPKAYEAYLRGRFYRNMFTEAGLRKAFTAYEEAISYDSDYALAYAGIADYYIWLSVYGILPPKECNPPAKKAALRAIELDDALAEAYASLAFIQVTSDFDWIEAEKNAVRAVELNPNYAIARLWYSYILVSLDRTDEGIGQAKRAIELDPSTFLNYLVLALGYYFARRADEAVAQVNLNVENFSSTAIAYQNQSWILREFGSPAKAVAAAKLSVEISGGSMFSLLTYAQSLAADNQNSQAEEILQRVSELSESQYVSSYQLAIAYVYLNETQKALDALERAYEDREGWLIWLRGEPALDALRREPRFIDLLTKVNRRTHDGAAAATVTKTKETAENQNSIAVLPFKFLQTNGDEPDGETGEFLGIGLADALITRLSNVRQFLVRPTGSILIYGKKNVDSLAAGKELKVQYVLDGSIFKTASRIRVSVQMLAVKDAKTVWAERFDEDLTDVLTLEDKISEKVAEMLVPHLTAGEMKNLAKRGTDDAEAYEEYLRGRFHWNTFTEEGFRKAVLHYQRAVEIDPNYASAHQAIADYYNWLGVFGSLPSHEAFQSAKKFAGRAIEIDDNFSEAYASLGTAILYGDYDWRTAERHTKRAIELNPNSAVVRIWHSHNLILQKRFDESVENVKRACQLDPTSFESLNFLAWNYYFARRYDEAFETIEQVIEKFPLLGASSFGKSYFLRIVGKTEESLALSQHSLKISNDSSYALYSHAETLAAAGRLAEAEAFLAKIKNQLTERADSHYHTAMTYCWANDFDRTLEELEMALENREAMLLYFFVEPGFDKLRGDSRLFEFFEKISFIGLEPSPPLVRQDAIKPATAEREQNSIAVLPFRFLNKIAGDTTGESGEFLGVGLADALITRLSIVRRIIVRPTSSVLRYDSSDADSFAAGSELSVKFILDGNIMKSGGRLRVSVQLLNVAEKSTVWAERFDEAAADVLQLEDSISARIAKSIVPQLTAGEIKDLGKRGTNDAKAYEAYLRGRVQWNALTEDGIAKAFAYFQEAIAHDPDYAQAHAAIADYYVWLGIYGALPLAEFHPPAKRAALRAIELDSHSSEAHAALGLLSLYGEYDWQASEKNIRRAIELNPNNSVAQLWFAHPLYSAGRFAEGETHIERALELDPLSLQNHMTEAHGYYNDRRIDQALVKARKIIEKYPDAAYAHWSLSCFSSFAGNAEDALAAAQKAAALSNDSIFTVYAVALALAVAGRTGEALKIIENPDLPPLADYHKATLYCYLKNKEKVFELLERSFAKHESPLIWLGIEPLYDYVRDDDRYWNTLKRMNHPLAKKNTTRQLPDSPKLIAASSQTSEAETIIQNQPDAEPRRPKTLKYVLTVIALIIIAYLAYNIFNY